MRGAGQASRTEQLEPFDPACMAGRILGKGDVVALVEKAAAAMDFDTAQRLEKKVRSKQGMDLADFLVALKQMQAMGPIKQVLGLLPGVNAKMLKDVNADDKRLKHVEAIVLSMTPAERTDPKIIDGSRRSRIARGSGTQVSEVKGLIERFEQARTMMQQMARGGGMPGMGIPGMGGMPGVGKRAGALQRPQASKKKGKRVSGNPAKRAAAAGQAQPKPDSGAEAFGFTGGSSTEFELPKELKDLL